MFRRAAERLPGMVLGPIGSALLSLLLLGAIFYEIGKVDFAQAWAELPISPLFWCAFLLYFWGGPYSEWLILNRLWRAPFSGYWAVLRKMAYNELILSYLGDAYFFAWLKRSLPHIANPFAVVKDMAIVSAFMGSVATILAIAATWPFFSAVDRIGANSPLILCLALALASGGLIALFRKALLGLSWREIAWIGTLCGLRIVGQAGCAVLMWWSLAPEVGIASWLVLSAVRMVSARLPLVPSKDLAFAAVAIAIAGPSSPVAPVIVFTTSLILLANIMLAGGLSLASWISLFSSRRAVAA